MRGEYTRRWHRRHAGLWIKHLAEFVDRPTIYLELGVFEGGSIVWMTQNILLHPESKATGVDPWNSSCKPISKTAVYARAVKNTAGHDKITLIRQKSADFLLTCSLPLQSVDIAYIDGGHHAPGPYLDSLLVWPLIRPGGIVIWDDHCRHLKMAGVFRGVQRFLAGCDVAPLKVWRSRRQIAFRKATK